MRNAAGTLEAGKRAHRDLQLEYVKSMILFATKRYGLEPPKLAIKFSELGSHEAGHIFSRNGTWYIEIDGQHKSNPLSLAAIAVHEVAHVLLGQRGVSIEQTNANEELTDAVTVLAGFGKIMHRACLQEYSMPFQRITVKLGYLKRGEIAYLARLQRLIHKQRSVRRWCPVAVSEGRHIQCYACASVLKAPPSFGTFDVRCTHCGMRQRVTFRHHAHSASRWQQIRRKVLHSTFLFADYLRGFSTAVIPTR